MTLLGASHHDDLETTFTSGSGRIRLLDFMDVTPGNASATRPVPRVLVRIIEGIDGEVEIVSRCAPRPDYARAQPHFDAHGCTATFDRFAISGPANWLIDSMR